MADFDNLSAADQLKFEGMLLGMSFRELSQLLEPRNRSRGGHQAAGAAAPAPSLAALAGALAPRPQPAPPSQLPASIPAPLAQLLAARSGAGGRVPLPPPRPLGAV